MNDNLKNILDIEIHLPEGDIKMNLGDDLVIHMDDLNSDFVSQPAKFAYWATMAVQATAACDTLKRQIARKEDYTKKILVAQLDAQVRKQLELDGEKITEAKVEKGIYATQEYIDAMEEIANMQEEYEQRRVNAALLAVARDALIQKKDALISLGANIRAEAQVDPSIMNK